MGVSHQRMVRIRQDRRAWHPVTVRLDNHRISRLRSGLRPAHNPLIGKVGIDTLQNLLAPENRAQRDNTHSRRTLQSLQSCVQVAQVSRLWRWRSLPMPI